MLDIESIRNEAFQYLHQMPHFCSDVILLIEELEKSRDTISGKQKQLDEDALIIHGLVAHYRHMEKLVILSKRYAGGLASKAEFDVAWGQFTEILKV